MIVDYGVVDHGVVGNELKLTVPFIENYLPFRTPWDLHVFGIRYDKTRKMSGQNIVKMMEAMKKMTRVVKPPGPPKVWEVVEKKGKDGRPIKFTIQEIPQDRNTEAVDHMCKHFLKDEPTRALFSKSLLFNFVG